MPQTIKLKRSATPGQVPTIGQLDLGELAINTNDGKMFLRKSDGTTDVVLEINGSINGTSSKVSTGVVSPTDPVPIEGDLWFDNGNDKLMYYDGTTWQEVGNTLSAINVTGNSIIGDSAVDTLTVNSTTLFNAPVTIDDDLTVTGSTILGDDAAADSLTINSLTTFSGTDGVTIPSGTTGQRVTANTGTIRYNTDTSSFEGYSGTSWGSLGGVKDVDQDTYLTTETSAGSDEDTFTFVAGGVTLATWDATNGLVMNTQLVSQPGAALTFDGQQFTNASKFTVLDASGNIQFGGWVLDTDTTITN